MGSRAALKPWSRSRQPTLCCAAARPANKYAMGDCLNGNATMRQRWAEMLCSESHAAALTRIPATSRAGAGSVVNGSRTHLLGESLGHRRELL